MKKLLALLLAAALALTPLGGCAPKQEARPAPQKAAAKVHPDLAKKEVRQAINLLIDKDAVASVYGDNAAALTSHLHPDSEMYNTSLTPFKRDVAAARKLLEDAGFDFGREIRIAYFYPDQASADAVELVADNLADAGIKASCVLFTTDLGNRIYVERDYDMLFCGEAADDPAEMYSIILGVGGYFDAIIGDPVDRDWLFNTPISEYSATNDFAKQKEIVWQLQENGVDFCGAVPVIGMKNLCLYNSRNLSLPEEIFKTDWTTRDLRFEDWELVGSSDTLNLVWTARTGGDGVFESPWTGSGQSLFTQMVFEPLYNYQADGSIVYKLAADMEISDDGLTYTFTMRDGAVWSDGTPVTAKDAAFSLWGSLADPHGAYKNGLLSIEGAADVMNSGAAELSGVTVDGNKLIVKTSEPNSSIIGGISKVCILPKHLLGEVAAGELSSYEDYWKKPVGSGQYKIDVVSLPDNVSLSLNDRYWGEPAGIGRVQFTSYPLADSNAAMNSMIAGKIDFAVGSEWNDIAAAESIVSINPHIKVLRMTGSRQRQILFNWAPLSE